MRASIVFSISLAIGLAASQPGHAQDAGGNVESGRALARAWCSECHQVGTGRPGVLAADFVDIANLPSTTGVSLKVFLQTSHKAMPNLILTPAQSDDIIAYILSLKRK